MFLFNLSLTSLIVMIIAVILSMSIHEVAHGLVSYWLGDSSAKYAGRLSLNPFRHIDWLGLLCLLCFGFGWAKPVPIDPSCYKDPKTGIIWTSFAGPLANFLLSFLCVILYYMMIKLSPQFFISTPGQFIAQVFASTASMSIGFGIFNLIPIPPLDGAKIVWSFLPDSIYYKINNGAWWMNLLFFALLYSGIIGQPIGMLRSSIIEAFSTVAIHLFGL
ncbi:hypothetical protein C815_00301 [Firmicutes bacterium M10-2]|nr:hypothetical protein C815_00301 [Firmicutes bacterium M10-2]